MARTSRGGSLVPLVLGLAMLAAVVLAGLMPNTGIVQAQSNSPYSQTSTSGLSPWVYLGVAAVVIVAGLLLALFLLRRRRPPSATAPPVQVWQGSSGAGGRPDSPSAPPPPPATAPAYLESPEDVGHALPPAPATMGAAAGAGTTAGAGTGEAGPDIDSLMSELDKISSEILKRGPRSGAARTGTGTDAEPAADV
jgi:hypothetical protein